MKRTMAEATEAVGRFKANGTTKGLDMSRDMTDRAFKKALEKYGFHKVSMWVEIGDTHSIGCTYTYDKHGNLKLDKRGTLKKAIAEKAKLDNTTLSPTPK